MLLIINHGQGNIGSLANTISFLGFDYEICSKLDKDVLARNWDGFILPGVGTFNAGMQNMREKSLDKLVYSLYNKGIKGLGICLGMQMLCSRSEEDNFTEKGLNLIEGDVIKLNSKEANVPSIGWRKTKSKGNDNEIIKTNGTFYYVHSYAVVPKEKSAINSTYQHGNNIVTASIYSNNILGVQFHPEKSQGDGLNLIQQFFSKS